ncbi:MAG: hypothetical protein ABEH35_07725 [Haloarculaceae archaeon]
MRGRLLVVGLLALTAGCGGLGVSDGGANTPTLTPVPVPDTPEAESGVYPPGVDPGGTVDADRLVDSHYEALEGRSYTRYERRVISVGHDRGVTVERFNATTWVGDGVYRRDVRRVHRREGGAATESRTSTLVVEDRRYTHWSVNDSVAVERAESTRPPATGLRELLAVNVTSVRLTGYGSEPFVRIGGHGSGAPGVPNDTTYRIDALVSSEGIVRQLTVTLGPEAVGSGYDMVYVLRYRGIDETTVPRPDWLEQRSASAAETR